MPRTASLSSHPSFWARLKSCHYVDTGSSRDLRIDFMRGIVLFILVIVHIDIFSIYNLLVWERIGAISGAEGFVIFSGVVLGMVHKRKIEQHGWKLSCQLLFNRSFQIYRVNVVIIIAVMLITAIGLLDTTSITTFTNYYANKTYSLMPGEAAPIRNTVKRILLLQVGPHQTQVLGLYVVLLAITPLALWLLQKQRLLLLLFFSWALYFYNWDTPVRPTQAQFEYAFPLLCWQLLFFHGLIFGYYRREIADFFNKHLDKNQGFLVFIIIFTVFFGFMLFSLNNPNPNLPSWWKLSFIEADKFHNIYNEYFRKNTLGILRLVNYLFALIVFFKILSVFWKPIHKYTGWFFIPIGQATLYVFILHVFLCLLIANIPMYKDLMPAYGSGNIWLNTLAHTFVLALLWLMVKFKVAFKWIPR